MGFLFYKLNVEIQIGFHLEKTEVKLGGFFILQAKRAGIQFDFYLEKKGGKSGRVFYFTS